MIGRTSAVLAASKKDERSHLNRMNRGFLLFALMCCLPGLNSAQSAYDQPSPPVQITHGPVVELIADSTAQIAWSTNVNAGTLLHYGTDPQNLNQTASMPWGGLTHRVVLKNLSPSTTYYFRAESADGQDTGTRAEAPQLSFKTVAAGETPIRNK